MSSSDYNSLSLTEFQRRASSLRLNSLYVFECGITINITIIVICDLLFFCPKTAMVSCLSASMKTTLQSNLCATASSGNRAGLYVDVGM